MVVTLHQITAFVYLAAAIAAGIGGALAHERLARISVWVLAFGAVLHGICFSQLHTLDPTPPLTQTSLAMSFMAWVGTLGFLLLLWRSRLSGLVVGVAPLAFLGVFFASLRLPDAVPASIESSGSIPHAHVLLASAGLSFLGLAGLAGILFLAEHWRLKHKRPLSSRTVWPSLEALDRVNGVALAVGFPLLSLGVVTGAIWVQLVHGVLWTGSVHETFSLVAWAIYAVLVTLRFGVQQPARESAMSAIGGFAFLAFAVLGVELFT